MAEGQSEWLGYLDWTGDILFDRRRPSPVDRGKEVSGAGESSEYVPERSYNDELMGWSLGSRHRIHGRWYRERWSVPLEISFRDQVPWRLVWEVQPASTRVVSSEIWPTVLTSGFSETPLPTGGSMVFRQGMHGLSLSRGPHDPDFFALRVRSARRNEVTFELPVNVLPHPESFAQIPVLQVEGCVRLREPEAFLGRFVEICEESLMGVPRELLQY